MFLECYNASLVSHTSVCVKVFRENSKYASIFPTEIEAILISKLSSGFTLALWYCAKESKDAKFMLSLRGCELTVSLPSITNV